MLEVTGMGACRLDGATSGANSRRETLGLFIVDSEQIVGNRLEIQEVTGIRLLG
jgi:hypothetical protein